MSLSEYKMPSLADKHEEEEKARLAKLEQERLEAEKEKAKVAKKTKKKNA